MKQENRNNVDFIKEKVRDVLETFVKHHNDLHTGDLSPRNSQLNGLAMSISNSANWDSYYMKVFRHDLNVRQYLFEMCGTRNQFSHRDGTNEFSDDDVFRTAHTATRLLNAINSDAAMDARNEILEIERAYGGLRYGNKESQIDTVMDLPSHETTADDSIPLSDVNKTEASDTEKESVIAEDLERNVLNVLTEPINDSTTPRDAAAPDNVEGREDTHNYIHRRFRSGENVETPAQVVERELPRLNECAVEEDTREDKTNRSLIERNYPALSRSKRKRPPNRLPKSERSTSSNVIERGSEDSYSETQKRNLIILVFSVTSILIGLLISGVLQENLFALLLLVLLIPVLYMAFKRWLEHKEELRRMEIESQRKTFFQRFRQTLDGIRQALFGN